jgi:hypothetical protein
VAIVDGRGLWPTTRVRPLECQSGARLLAVAMVACAMEL